MIEATRELVPMIRTCNGSDDDLTHQIPVTAYDPSLHTLSSWNRTARPGYVIIRCTCGLTFEDKDRTVTYPHTPFMLRRQP
jgi:hypothetical protein